MHESNAFLICDCEEKKMKFGPGMKNMNLDVAIFNIVKIFYIIDTMIHIFIIYYFYKMLITFKISY